MNFGGLYIGEPGWLLLALVGPALLLWLYVYAWRQRARQLARMASPHFVGELTASHSTARRRLKEIAAAGIGFLTPLPSRVRNGAPRRPTTRGWGRTWCL